MGLLEDLKRQAGAQRERESALARDVHDNVLLVDDAMHRSFLYLNDLVKQLNVLKLPSPRAFDITPGVRFEGMRLAEFFIDYRKKLVLDRERYNTISLTFQYRSDQVLKARKELPPMITRFENILRAAGASFEVKEARNDRQMVTHADFAIPCDLRAGITARAEHETGTIRFTIRNVERLGAFDLVFRAEEIDDPLLEGCARYILGESNTFRAVGRYAGDARPLSRTARLRRLARVT